MDELPRGASGKVVIDTISEILAKKTSIDPSPRDIYTIASDCFQVPVDVLSPDSTPYNTEGWDSLAHLEFIARLEENFDLTLSANEIVDLGSLADAESIIVGAMG